MTGVNNSHVCYVSYHSYLPILLGACFCSHVMSIDLPMLSWLVLSYLSNVVNIYQVLSLVLKLYSLYSIHSIYELSMYIYLFYSIYKI